MDKIQELLDKVEVLPLSPTLLPKLLPKLSDVDTNFDEVVEIIAYDPALTSKLLQICNSAFFGSDADVSTVAEAVSRVGYQSVYLLVAMINGSNCFPCPSPGVVDTPRLWRHSITVAFNAKFVAESAGEDGGLLFTAGLLHDLGKLILGQEKSPSTAGLFNAPTDAASLQREMECFGCTHPEVGARLLERWKLPEELGKAVRYHHEPKEAKGFERMAACVTVGNLITHGQDRPQILERAELKENLELLGLSKDNLRRWSERLRDHQSLVSGMSRLPI
jgi:putative nucleotidyltransferase with HDIG domain